MQKHRSIHRQLLASVILVLAPMSMIGQQSPFEPEIGREASQITEHLELFADRSVYVVGEQVHFRADLVVEGVPPSQPWSSILYAELISARGASLASAKYAIAGRSCQGQMAIPSGILTGNYFLKCYTRWMRNMGPGGFSYTPLKIINPFRPEVDDPLLAGEESAGGISMDYVPGLLVCTVPQNSYDRGEEMTISISVPGGMENRKVECCLTVVPSGAIDTVKGQLSLSAEPDQNDSFMVKFLPDLCGVSISGSLVRMGEENAPVQNAKLHFSLMGNRPDYFATVTGPSGRFVVSLPVRTGVQELFVTPEISGNEIVEVRIDQDFDAGVPLLPAIPFSLSGTEKVLAIQMVQRVQLEEVYSGSIPRKDDSVPLHPVPFYGRPLQSVNLDDFVDLPTLEEVFINLVPTVTAIKRREGTTLMIHSENPTLKTYTPLIMIDQIPVFDYGKLLSIAPEKISRIDVINDVYVKGSVAYGGLINLITREGDMAGIDLAPGSYFFDYLAIYSDDKDVELTPVPGDLWPDTRNTILWIPDLLLLGGSPQDITFRAPDYPGEYVMLFRGTAASGELLSTVARFTVR